MGVELVFPSYLYRGSFRGAKGFNDELTREILALRQVDRVGRAWSRRNYVGGYSSYSSMDRLHLTSPNFAELERRLRPHVRRFVKALQWDLGERELTMTTCWANWMGYGTHHTMHTHPLCVLSGVYYVNVPPGSSGFKIEDPRMGLLMASPPRRAQAPANVQNYMHLRPVVGGFTLFESWMRHEVPPHYGRKPRLSVSFNYEWA